MNGGLYKNTGLVLDNNKLRGFIKKNHIFPDKYRPSAYKYLLNLPISKN